MNNNIIKKCLDELQKDTPRKDYVIGMLETLYELSNNNLAAKSSTPPFAFPGLLAQNENNKTYVKTDEEEIIPEFLKPGAIGKITN